MTAPTSEERINVAEALRGLRHRTYYSEEVVENIKDAIGITDPVNTFREPEDVYELLAELIDPVCHVVTTGERRGRPIGSACSVCHAPLYPSTAWTGGMWYCSQCGHRVVDDGD